jgi:hypothetical protein
VTTGLHEAIAFPAQHPAEHALLEAWTRAAVGHAPIADADVASLGSGLLRASYLRWLLVSGGPTIAPGVQHATLIGAHIGDDLDLSGTKLALTPKFVGCTFSGRILLSDAEIVGLEIVGGSVLDVVAERMRASASVAIRKANRRDGAIPAQYQVRPCVHRQLIFHGADIGGNFDLRGCKLGGAIHEESRIPLFADGLKISGNLLLSERFRARGEVRLNGCQIGRNLDLTGARLSNPQGRALMLQQGRISGAAYLRLPQGWSTYPNPSRFGAIGLISLSGTRIDGALDCSGGVFVAPIYAGSTTDGSDSDDWKMRALEADGVTVGDGVRLGDTARFRGEVHLVNSRVTGDLDCDGGFFDHPGREAIAADGIAVTGTTFFKDGIALRRRQGRYVNAGSVPAKTSGFIRLAYGEYKQGLQFEGLQFVPSRRKIFVTADQVSANTVGIQAEYTTIGGRLQFQNIVRQGCGSSPPPEIEFDLRQAKAAELDDDKESWEKVSVLHVGGFEYAAIKNLDARELPWRLRMLDRNYARPAGQGTAAERALHFQPQPYLKLAQVMQQAGFDAAATEIRICLEKHRTEFGGFGWVIQTLRSIFGFTIHYGYHPFRVAYFLAGWLLVSTLAFEFCRSDFIFPAKRTEKQQMSTAKGELVDSEAGKYDLRFNAFFFALDSLIPIVDLRQRSNYFVQPPQLAPWRKVVLKTASDPLRTDQHVRELIRHSFVPWLGVINPYLGWTLTTLFVIGISGLVRKS